MKLALLLLVISMPVYAGPMSEAFERGAQMRRNDDMHAAMMQEVQIRNDILFARECYLGVAPICKKCRAPISQQQARAFLLVHGDIEWLRQVEEN